MTEPRDSAGEARLLALVRAQVADVVGFDGPEDVGADVNFGDMGFDSMAMVELSTALQGATGLEVPVTLGFDHPTPAALATYLHRAQAGTAQQPPTEPVVAGEDVDDPIVIVGMSCRFPGGVRSPDDLLALVAGEVDAVAAFPDDRGWPSEGLVHPDPAHPHTSVVREGGFIDDVDAFDAAFFGIGPREATAMDPQQRLLLESAWEAFEHARIDPASVRGTAAGVYVGLATHDYYGARASTTPAELERHFVLGNAGSVASGRIAYALGLEGPAVTVDTACSSSLVALHLACAALRQGECTSALAGGVSVYTTPETFVTFSRQRSLSSDGRCRAYSDTADGTGFAEGVGFVLLERRSDARRLGHAELAVIRGSAINQDGASNGLTAPNGPSQERVIRRALASAGLAPADVDLVEGHGTGTTLGDPIEARALLATYGAGRPDGEPLWLGSLKSNIAHAQAAAGVAGLIKVVMAMRAGRMPKTLHVGEPTSHVDWSSGAVRLLAESREWPRGERPRRGAVSAFGISGTNAHVIVEEPAVAEVAEVRTPAAPLVTPWALSARTAGALREQGARLRDHLARRPAAEPLDVAHSLLATRAAHEHRAVVVGREREELLAGLDALAAGADAPNVVRGTVSDREPVAFAFAGQGTHWAGMARELRATSPVFAASLRTTCAALAAHLDWSIEAVLDGAPDARSLDRAEVSQPAVFAVMVALAELWRSFGVEPAVVIGHSQGEVAAAYVAGALTLDDAARLVVRRSRALTVLGGRGGLLSLALPVDEARRRLERWGGRLSIAAINGPASVVVSGDGEALDELLSETEPAGIWARRLAFDVPAHSPHVDELRERLLGDLAGIAPRATDVRFASAVTGSLHDTTGLDADYWFRNLRHTVRFSDAVLAASAYGCRTFVEISPHPVLAFGLAGTLETAGVDLDDVAVVSSLRRDDGGLRRMATSVAELHARGQPIDWRPLLGERGARSVDLPTYAFERSRFWLGAAEASAAGPPAAGLHPTGHPLLTGVVALAGRDERLFSGRVALAVDGWIADHAVMDRVVLPGTAFVELALRAARAVGCDAVEELTLQAPLVLADDDAPYLQLLVGEPDEAGRRALTIDSRPQAGDEDAPWTRHASGTLARDADGVEAGADVPLAWPPRGPAIDVAELYDRLLAHGVAYGPAFRGLRAAWRADDAVLAEVRLDEETAGSFEIHPALFDAAFHAMGERLLDAEPGQAWLPFSWSGVRLHQRGVSSVRARLSRAGEGLRLEATDEQGALVVTVDSVVVRQVTAAQLAAAAASGERLSLVDWRGRPPGRDAPVRVAVLGGRVAGLDAQEHADVGTLAAAVADAAAPEVVLASVARGDAAIDLPASARAATERALEQLQAWLADDRLADTRLAFLTRGAVATTPDEAPDPVGAAVWGLARSARAEHADRILLVDSDGAPASSAALHAALSAAEPELALRDGRLLVPRLARAPAGPGEPRRLDPAGTVLVTGGLSGLGAGVARHLVSAYGARHLLLVSRRGRAAPAAAELEAELRALGAEVRIAACDVADRDALGAVLAQVPAAHPLTGVVHAAGVLDDGVVTSLTPEKLDRVMRPKIDAASHLHALTEDLDLELFVLFSSIAGTLGGVAQGNYAAANAFLDALAQGRRARGLAGVSIAWGLWARATEIIDHLDDGDFARLARMGIAPLTDEAGFGLLDAALALDHPLVVAARLDVAALRALGGAASPLVRGLAGGAGRGPGSERGASLAQRLAGVPDDERPQLVLDLVSTHAAAVLGHESVARVEPQRAFKDLGFDSIGAVELRNRLAAATGLRLSATMVFDHASPAAVATHLLALAARDVAVAPSSPGDELVDRLEALLADADDERRAHVAARLRSVLAGLGSAPARDLAAADLDTADRLRAAGVDELFELIDRDLQER